MHSDAFNEDRSRSPSLQPSSASRQRDSVPEYERNVKAQEGSPVLPGFLKLSGSDIHDRFEQISLEERGRLIEGFQDPESSFAFPPLQQSRLLDRYGNVRPWNSNRVRLQVPTGQNDYINASPIVLKSEITGRESRYISMQGPKEISTNHVWRMIWDETDATAVIVMLTETHEAGQEKCHAYFPATPEDEALKVNEANEFEDGFKATVTCVEKSVAGLNDAIEVRRLVMKASDTEEEKTIWHLLYTKWPDFGVPDGADVKAFFETMKLSQKLSANGDSPRIIHCSAGVGRSGTFIALDHLMGEVESGAFENEELRKSRRDVVYDTVSALRNQRCLMVQAETQFAFVYAQLRRLWELKHSRVRSESKSFKMDDAGSKVFD